MKSAIVYASQTGTAAKCARELAGRLEADLLEADGDSPDITRYDAVILGGGIRLGRLNRSLRKWITCHRQELGQKTLGLFLCCCFEDQADAYFRKNFPPPLLERAAPRICFGGELEPATLKGFDRLIVGMAAGTAGPSLCQIHPEAIDRFVDDFRVRLYAE
ncbi:MAG: hypothetical protein HFJ80_02055 [Clostridiales bacterium]|nr:hypothetical protein [Clostridiales bacterium]